MPFEISEHSALKEQTKPKQRKPKQWRDEGEKQREGENLAEQYRDT